MNTPDQHTSDLEDPRVIEALDEYVAALEKGQKPDRKTFLARHPEIAPALAECLEGMEVLHGDSSAAAVDGGGATLAGSWQPGTPLGDFRIVREIGRGGMGVVYEAEQLSLGRRIALKVLPFALTLDPRQLQRFKNEARAAAQLHHQHIVPVHNVGSERGVHFYAMQYIEGQSLAEVIRELRQLAGATTPAPAGKGGTPTCERPAGASTGPYLLRPAPDAGSTVNEPAGALATEYSKNNTHLFHHAARLGVQAAEALEHAHQYGVAHRDIKPGNLLVDGHGNLWITDFGLAQFQSDAGITQTGDLLGTLRYMSPEQAAGQRTSFDHRTDIYSLGATLYELLTLRPPFDGADRQALLHQILHDEPRPPRSINKNIPPELETIVLKAMAKIPAERYNTAQDLADDLSCFLHHRPIRARRANLTQRLRKWARRHPSFVGAGVVLCLLTAVGSAISAGMIKAAYDREQERAQQAEDRFQLAKAWVDEIFRVSEEDLADQPPLEGLRRKLLENTLVYYQKLIEQHRDASAGQAALTTSRARVQQILTDLAVLQGAGKLHLLSEESVLDDLQFTSEQRKQIRDRWGDLERQPWKGFRAFATLTSEERRQRFLDRARTQEAAIAPLLTSKQKSRLRQIDLQVQGPRAFDDPEVVKALQLSAVQKQQIRSSGFRMGPGHGEGPKPTGGPPGTLETVVNALVGIMGGPKRGGKPPGMSSPAFAENIKAVLTESQMRRWQELTGTPFKGKLSRKGRGGPPNRESGPPDRGGPATDCDKPSD